MWKYVGEGTLLGVPARDLTDEEYELYAAAFKAREGVTLDSTGFYVRDEPKGRANRAASEGD